MTTDYLLQGPEGLEVMRLLSRKGALSLELKGLRRRGRSAYSICKSEYGLKGTRESVLRQMEQMVEDATAHRIRPIAEAFTNDRGELELTGRYLWRPV